MFTTARITGEPFFRSKCQRSETPNVTNYNEMDASRDHGLCDDLIHYQRLRRSTTGRTTAYHVGTRRRRVASLNNKLTNPGEKATRLVFLRKSPNEWTQSRWLSCRNIVSCCVLEARPFACDVEPATIEQDLLTRRSTEYRKNKAKTA